MAFRRSCHRFVDLNQRVPTTPSNVFRRIRFLGRCLLRQSGFVVVIHFAKVVLILRQKLL